jgi:hypothetical protein
VSRVGISPGYTIIVRPAVDQAFEAQQIVDVGAKLVRLDYTAGNAAKVDPLIEDFARRGIETVLLLGGSSKPVNATQFAEFAGGAARKYAGKVRFYEIFNEPNLHEWTPALYVPVLRAAYEKIKAEDPAAYVLTGGVATAPDANGDISPLTWVRGLYQNGARGAFDVMNLHLYEDATVLETWNIWYQAFHGPENIRSLMDQNGDGEKFVVSTESGYQPGTGNTTGSQKETTQVTTMRRAYEDFATRPRTGFILVYTMMNDSVPGWGLLRDDRSRRPAFGVLQGIAANGP